MGVLKTLTDEYFGDSIREEDKIPIGDLDVEIVSFKDNNGKFHKHGYRVKEGNPDEMAKTLSILIERIIEKRGPECSLNDIDVSNQKKMIYKDEKYVSYGVFCTSPFNGDISGWDVSSVENMQGMFGGAKSFNQSLDKWDVSNVKDMSFMFIYAKSFNQDISGWNVSNVEDMKCMFEYATSFNQPLDNWGDKLSKVENMNDMFCDATSFNQDISGWDVSKVENMSGMFNNTPLKKNNKLPKWYLDRMKK